VQVAGAPQSEMIGMGNDCRARYGPPEAETYIVRDGIVLTVFYSGQGRACKAVIDPGQTLLQSVTIAVGRSLPQAKQAPQKTSDVKSNEI
jgi:hypothetical protein